MKLPILVLLALVLSACGSPHLATTPSSSPAISADFANRSICLAFRADPKPSNEALIRAVSDYGTLSSSALQDAIRTFLAVQAPNYVNMNDQSVFGAYSQALGRVVNTCAALIGPAPRPTTGSTGP